jgi:hypothetical protein
MKLSCREGKIGEKRGHQLTLKKNLPALGRWHL